jgi:biopolymer transport protein ExbD
MARRKHRRLTQPVDLDITAFMNLMIVLVPVLLLSMVFAQTAVLELNFPIVDDSKIPLDDEKNIQLQLIIRSDGMRLADSKAGLIKFVPKRDNLYDFEGLSGLLKQVKAKLPDKTDITLLLEEDIDYQVLVSSMDVTRSYPAVLAASVVDAELFPDISIGDAPELNTSDAQISEVVETKVRASGFITGETQQ